MIVLYINHIIISSTLYALDVYNLEVDTTVLRYYFWITIALITLIVASIAWLFDYHYAKSNQNKDLTICEQIIHEHGGNYLTHLIYSGDKDYFVHDNESAF